MNDTSEKLRKDLILVSAFNEPPPDDGKPRANCARVLRVAMTTAGLWEDRLDEAFHGDLEQFPLIAKWYSTLIAMTHDDPPSARLLEGGGNLDLPAGAHFTACWLTSAGRTVAERLLVEHPEWRAAVDQNR